VSLDREVPESGVERAALAYSLFPLRFADAVNEHLSITERQRLREGLARIRTASDTSRVEAVRALSAAVRKGVVFPRPAAHDHRDCPFRPVGQRPRPLVAELLERVARRDPIEVVVTLCHLDETSRQELWTLLAPQTRTLLLPRLDEVHLMSGARTREYARDMNERLKRANTRRRS
jgi:hypothetical protein